MLGLGLGITASNKPFGINLASFAGIKAWYKFKTGITLDRDDVVVWEDSSGNTVQNMELRNTGQIPYNSSAGRLSFSTALSNKLQTASDFVELIEFTMFIVMDVVESGASNEFVIGAGTTDKLELYNGGDPRSINFVANNAAYTLALSTNVPSGKILINISRRSNGVVTCAINETVTGSVVTNPGNRFDVAQIANGSSDMDFYEAVVYAADLSTDDKNKITAHLLSKHGIS